MMRLKNDLLDLIEASIYKKLKRKKITWTNEKAITIVAASKGYPGNYKKFKEIKNIKKIKLNKKNNYLNFLKNHKLKLSPKHRAKITAYSLLVFLILSN